MLFPKEDCPGFHEGEEEEGGENAGRPSTSSSPPPPPLFPPRRGRTRVSLSLTPFQPFAVIAAHSLAMEAEFVRRARRERRLWSRRREKEASVGGGGGGGHRSRHHHHGHSDRASMSAAHRLHLCAGAAAVAAFFAEDLWPRLPFVHSTWHVFSAVAMVATEPLVDDAERRLVRGRARAEAEGRKRGGV